MSVGQPTKQNGLEQKLLLLRKKLILKKKMTLKKTDNKEIADAKRKPIPFETLECSEKGKYPKNVPGLQEKKSTSIKAIKTPENGEKRSKPVAQIGLKTKKDEKTSSVTPELLGKCPRKRFKTNFGLIEKEILCEIKKIKNRALNLKSLLGKKSEDCVVFNFKMTELKSEYQNRNLTDAKDYFRAVTVAIAERVEYSFAINAVKRQMIQYKKQCTKQSKMSEQLKQDHKKSVSSLRKNIEYLKTVLRAEKTLNKQLRLKLRTLEEESMRTLARKAEEKAEIVKKSAEKRLEKTKKTLIEMEKRLEVEKGLRKNSQTRLLRVTKSFDESRVKAQSHFDERIRVEKQRLVGVEKRTHEERKEFKETLEKRDKEIKDLYNQLSAQDETIRKMGQSLMNLSKKKVDSELQNKLECSEREVMRLKSQVANLNEIKESMPGDIGEVIKKRFQIQNSYSLIKKKNSILEKTNLQQREKIKSLETEAESHKLNMNAIMHECQQRTNFYRKITNTILDKYKSSIQGLEERGKVSGFEEMYAIIASCENNELATPRLRRVVSRFTREATHSAPRAINQSVFCGGKSKRMEEKDMIATKARKKPRKNDLIETPLR